MRRSWLVLIAAVMAAASAAYTQEHTYPVQDFYNRSLTLPVDYEDPDGERFVLYYQLSSNFDYSQPTVFFLNDSQQAHGAPGEVDTLAQRYGFAPNLNLIRYEPRGRKYSYIEVYRKDGTIDWERAYRVLSSRQFVEDIERVRQDLFAEHPDATVHLFGRSGGAYLVLEYLSQYPDHAERAFVRCAPHPLIMEKIGYIESKFLLTSLDAVDPALQGKLEAVLERGTVPKLNLLWLLLRLGYQHPIPGPIQAELVNELYEGRLDSYETYLSNPRMNYAALKASEALLKQMGVGMFLRPIECDGRYLLGPEPEYVDPIYHCFRDLSGSFVELIEDGKVPPPTFPSLEALKQIEAEVFYLAGRYDHMSPYQIGVELEKYIPRYELFVAEDNHMFRQHPNCYPQLANAFFKHGVGSEELRVVRHSAECAEWAPE